MRKGSDERTRGLDSPSTTAVLSAVTFETMAGPGEASCSDAFTIAWADFTSTFALIVLRGSMHSLA